MCSFRSVWRLACSSSHSHLASLPSNIQSGSDNFERLGMNFPRYVSIPKNLRKSSLLLGASIESMALTFLGSGFTPSLLRVCPM